MHNEPLLVFLMFWEGKSGNYSGSSFVAAQSSFIARRYIEAQGDRVTGYQFVGEYAGMNEQTRRLTQIVRISTGAVNHA